MTNPVSLSPLDQGMMVCFALNHLWSDSQSQDTDFNACCPECCAACDLIRRLHRKGELDDIVQLAMPFHWVGNAWWVDGHVDAEWLYASWRCGSQPPCDNEDGTLIYEGETP